MDQTTNLEPSMVDLDIHPDKYVQFIELFNKIKGEPGKPTRYRMNSKIKRQYDVRLKEGYTLEDFAIAIRNCRDDKYHKQNPHFLTPEFITRPDKLECYLNVTPEMQNSETKKYNPSIWR